MTFSRRLGGIVCRGPRARFVIVAVAGVVGLLVGGGAGVAVGGGRDAVAQTQPASVDAAQSAEALGKLKEWLAAPADSRGKLVEQPWSKTALSRADADAAERLLWSDHSARLKSDRSKEMEAKVLKAGELEMPFWYKVNGEAPEGGRSLYISMHGGGGAPKQVNDQQWENQKRLYSPAEGVYVAPRAPTNTWDLWHQSHIDGLFDRLIENLVVFENVNPDRVYLMGYSAGGDGVYQVAPRMADRFAAASMMAGHPNESQPLGLRNLPFSLHMGGLDGAYNRNKVAEQWGEQLKKLREADPQGYEHWVKIYAGKGHWMDREDAAAVPWMAKFTRNPFPNRIVWRQDDVTEARFYWLGVSDEQRKAGAEVRAHVDGRRITLDLKGVEQIKVRLHDRLLDLDQPLEIKIGEQTAFAGRVARTIASQAASLAERADPRSVWRGEVVVSAAASK
ncbi:MAG TPA: dienelactone hydrolase family protein [Pirellulaceae bacterium]|nr:dienelactone hydrolase family protein [Pirellulaceae bacterium]